MDLCICIDYIQSLILETQTVCRSWVAQSVARESAASLRAPMPRCVSDYLNLPQNCRLVLPFHLVHSLSGREASNEVVKGVANA